MGEWYKAKVNEQTGYLFAEFVNKTETTENHQNQQRNRLQQNKQQKKIKDKPKLKIKLKYIICHL